jgi:hypothetical protein
MSHMVYCCHIAITSGDKATTRRGLFRTCPRCPRRSVSRCVILQTRSVATGGFGKVMSASCRLLAAAVTRGPLPGPVPAQLAAHQVSARRQTPGRPLESDRVITS